MGASEVNITVRNSSAAAAEILIRYSPAAASSPSAPATQASGATPSTNPFAGPDLAPLPVQPQPAPASPTPWAPWDGPCDKRDATPAGGGAVTSTGAPRIELSSTPAANQYNYTGPAARNPYFSTPSNPLREGYVRGFENWFTQPFILGSSAGPIPANKMYYATEEGAREALRIVQQFEPDARIDSASWSGGPFASSVPMYYISLPGGRLISAGGILATYYHGGRGVTPDSDALLERTLRMA